MASTDAPTNTQHPDYLGHIQALEVAKVGLFNNAYWNFDQNAGNIAQFRKVCDRVIADVYNRALANTLKDTPLVLEQFIQTLLLPEDEVEGDDDPKFARSPITPVGGPVQMTKAISSFFLDHKTRLANVNYLEGDRIWVTTHAQRGAMFFQGRVFAHLRCSVPYMWNPNADRTEAYTTISNDPELWSLLDKPTEGNERKSYLALIILLDAIDAILDGLDTLSGGPKVDISPIPERMLNWEAQLLTGRWVPITIEEQMKIWDAEWKKAAEERKALKAEERKARKAADPNYYSESEESDDDDVNEDATSHDGDN